MKVPIVISTMVVCALVSGCGSLGKSDKKGEISSPTPAVTKDQTLAAAGKVDNPLTIDVPSWYIKAPASTDEYMFVTGTAVSSDLSMSRSKAMLDAQNQLASKINGVINSITRQNRRDNQGTVTNDYTSVFIRKQVLETAITGYHLEDSKILPENRGYRTFVLVRYPVGDANRLLKEKQQLNQEKQDDEAIDREFEKGKKEKTSSAVQVSPVSSVTPSQPLTSGGGVIVTPVASLDRSKMVTNTISDQSVRDRVSEVLKDPNAVVLNATVR